MQNNKVVDELAHAVSSCLNSLYTQMKVCYVGHKEICCYTSKCYAWFNIEKFKPDVKIGDLDYVKL